MKDKSIDLEEHTLEVPIGPEPHAPKDASPGDEDKRLITALAGVHASGKHITIVNRDKVGPHLYFVEYSYTPAGGAHTESHALVYDNGTKTRVFGGH